MRTLHHAPLLEGSILQDQIDLETRAIRDGVARYRALARRSVEHKRGAALKPAERMLLHWFKPLVIAIRREQRDETTGEGCPGAPVWRPVFRSLRAERLAVATMHEVVSLCLAAPGGIPFASLTRAIGRSVFAELHMDLLKEENRDAWRELQRRFIRLSTSKVNWWANKNLSEPVYHVRASVHVGARLFWCLMGVASASSETFELAFHHERRTEGHKLRAYVRMDRRVHDIINEGHRLREVLRPRYLPMLVAPYPWKPGAEGGYVRLRTPLVSKIRPLHRDAIAAADLHETFDGLNAVSATAWRINRPVLDLVHRVWKEGGGDLGIPRGDDIPLPPVVRTDDPEEKKRMIAERRDIHRENNRLAAAREDFALKLQVADLTRGHDRFYMPMQLDYRGRCYPIPKHLNHYGDDLCRGLLEFSEPLPVTARGRWWIKVHAASLYGLDKAPFDDRVAWVDANMANIKRSVEDPDGFDWWKWADRKSKEDRGKPWQFLAACLALVDDEAAAHLPVQVDGTCNGLQHYAALGRDAAGAGSVNMTPADEPRDVYTIVANQVRGLAEEDADLGHPWAVRLLDRIARDVVKQTTMTSVYGVTAVGARKQILNKLRKWGLDDRERYEASAYLADLTMRGIGDVCSSARKIMDWFRALAKKIARANRPVAWTNPFGFPVVQPYRRYGKTRVQTVSQTVTLAVDDDNRPIAVKRQVDGFAPNYVHGVDAAHMFSTARAARAEGLEFAAVHDCYWSHANSMDRLGALIRERFVELHGRPLLVQLVRDLRKQDRTLKLDDPPEPGSFDLRTVLDAPYFFS